MSIVCLRPMRLLWEQKQKYLKNADEGVILYKKADICYLIGGGMEIIMQIQESGEMYLETVYMLKKEKRDVRSIDIVEHLGYSKPSVSRAVGLLKRGGYIEVDDGGFITLTDAGREVAEKMYERHTLLTKFLVGIGVSREVAAFDACKIEHHVSDESFEAIKAHARHDLKK